jgi:outer membrane protein insertion porin family
MWYKVKAMRKLFLAVLFIALPLGLYGQQLIEKIDISGNERVTQETIMYYITAREGDFYSEEGLKRDFRVLWSTGFFSDVRIEQSEGTSGKIVWIKVKENPVVKDITFKTGRKLKEDDIINKLKEKDQYILPYSYYSAYKVLRAQKTIEELLLEKGLQAGKVEVEEAAKGKNEVEVVFRIDEGPKVLVGEVVFEGRPKLPESELKSALGDNKEHNLISWITGKDVYKPNKLQEELDNVKKKLQENGYMEATIGEPRVEDMTRRTIFFKTKSMKRVIIPVNAGYLYRVGEISVEGVKAINPAYIRSLITLKTGDVYSTKVRQKCVEEIGKLYRNGGYLYCQVAPVENLDPRTKRVNVTFNIVEGEVCYLNRLDFKGNIYTKDKVMRREMLLREGDRLSLALFTDSILRIRQVGLVDIEKDPEIKPHPDDPTQFDVTVNVKELQRNNIQFTGGYSGYEGYFVALTYETVNFLGAGENLNLTLQTGKRIRNYSFGFTEPYVFDYPLSLGFNIFDRRIEYPLIYTQKTRGVDLSIGTRLYRYWHLNATYTYQDVNLSLPEGSLIDPIYFGLYGVGHYKESSISPQLYYSTIDSPLTPSRGTMYLVSLKFAGSFLGGEVDLIKPSLKFTHYQPTFRGQSIGIHAEYEYVRPLRSGGIIPYWERFFLGGERDIRGYEIYTIGPRSSTGTLLGGDKAVVINAEYIVNVGGPLYLILFHDMGNAVAYSDKIDFKNLYTSTGVEARIFVPALRVPFRLIFAYNNRKIYPDDSNFAFRFALGTTF